MDMGNIKWFLYNCFDRPLLLIHRDFRLIIHKEGSTEADRAKNLSLDLILKAGMQNDFKSVLLSRRFKSKLCTIAAGRGCITTLQWAYQNDCTWNWKTCQAAAERGHLDCLIWAREHGCDWNRSTCTTVAERGHLACFIWARQNGCL